MEMFFDTETTGFPKKTLSLGHPEQPWVIQLAYILRENGKIIEEKEYLIDIPVEIPEHITEITGLSKHHLKDGSSTQFVYDRFYDIMSQSKKVIGHNLSFDLEMMRIMSHRVQREKRERLTPEFICTMKSSVHACKIQNKHNRGYKWPNLTEAYKSLVNKSGFEKAHSALADTRACMEVYDKLLEKGVRMIYA
jgi:DNA polymerase III epsilon subunit-like protein